MKNIFTTSNPYYQRTMVFYEQYDKYVPIVSFFAGFSWDSFTLTRIDRLLDNFILLAYILLLGAFIVLSNLIEKQVLKNEFFVKYREWYPVIIQFLLGGLFSAYLIFYFQSADLSKNWLFIGLLLFLLVANEFLKGKLTNIYLQMLLYFLALFSFFIFFLPVITSHMNVWTFLAGGFISLLMAFGVLYLLFRFHAINSVEEFWRVSISIGSLFLILNLFYFMNWIPPIPLSLKFGGIYHQAKRVETGNKAAYYLTQETPKWYQPFKDSDSDYHYVKGDTVFCFTSVFAPTELQTRIYHRWQRFSPEKEHWQTTDKLSHSITGGRDGGWRSYTFKKHIQPGEWRIRVETESEQVLGQIYFSIIEVTERNYTFSTIEK